ncbi:MAG TPA: hypothetical protein VF638_00885 [Sphingomonas sp.]|jgi:hypothetical protein
MLRRSPITRKTPMSRVKAFLERRPAKPRAKPMRKAKPVKSQEERHHHEAVAKMPCIACGGWPVEVHHVRHNGRHGITRDHTCVVPVCAEDHRAGRNAVHTIGSPQFDALHGLVQFEIGVKLWEQHCAGY